MKNKNRPICCFIPIKHFSIKFVFYLIETFRRKLAPSSVKQRIRQNCAFRIFEFENFHVTSFYITYIQAKDIISYKSFNDLLLRVLKNFIMHIKAKEFTKRFIFNIT